MDTPSVIYYEHQFDDSAEKSLAKSVLNLGNECRALYEENTRLKAEVERLHKYVETMERESMSDEYDINHQTSIINGLLTDKERLKAEVERLRKAGDKMAKTLEKNEQKYNGCPSVEADSWWIARDGGCP